MLVGYMGSLHESALSVRHLGRSMNGLRAGMSAAPLMAAARVAAGVTSLTCHKRSSAYTPEGQTRRRSVQPTTTTGYARSRPISELHG
jgi:hypothetical protein